MKEGEKITINFANMPKGVLQTTQNNGAAPKKSGGLKKLAPPPGFKGKAKAAAPQMMVSTDLLQGPLSDAP